VALQIGAGTERLFARAGQRDDADILVVMSLAIALGEARNHLGIERHSGRLIVIQNARPRFSNRTLLSVLALLFRSAAN
jgi:hypothetical protein